MGNGVAELRRRFLRVGIAVALIVAADQITKSIAVDRLTRGVPVRVVGSLVQFDLASNSGGAFSSFQGATPLLAIGALAATFYLVRMVRHSDDRWIVAALTLLLGGALGNLSDRLFRAPSFLRGEVIDFIRLPNWPTFNIADMGVTFGAVLLVLRTLFGPRASTEPNKSAKSVNSA